jgi:hypothetical protein
MCVIAPPINIVEEIRFFIGMGEILTGSYYVKDGKRCLERIEEPSEFHKQYVKNLGFHPDSLYALDLCTTRGGTTFVLEIGAFSSAGLYMADTDKIVKFVNDLIS